MKPLIKMGLAALAAVVLAAGCEYMSDAPSALYNVTGSWLYSDAAGSQSTWTLDQSDSDVISGSGSEGETIRGSISGDRVSMTLTNSGSSTILIGTVSGETMSGTYTNSSSGSGAWTAVKTD